MMNGDISNRVSPSLLVRIQGTLIKKKTHKPLIGIIKRKETYELDFATFDFIMRGFIYTDYKIDLVIDPEEEKYLDIFKDFLNDNQIPYGCIRFLNTSQISGLINSGVYLCFIDNDISYLNRVGHTHCYTVKEANNFIKRG